MFNSEEIFYRLLEQISSLQDEIHLTGQKVETLSGIVVSSDHMLPQSLKEHRVINHNSMSNCNSVNHNNSQLDHSVIHEIYFKDSI